MAISRSTYFRHQREIIQPVVQRCWQMNQVAVLATLQSEQQGLVLGGDGRADSPGHSAKYGSYTMIELRINKLVDIQLVQV